MICALHGQERCLLCHSGGDSAEYRPDPRGPAKPDNMAVDDQGHVLPYNPEEVRAIVDQAVDQGELLFAVFQMPTGEYGVSAFVPPSEKLVEILETAARSFKRVLQGH